MAEVSITMTADTISCTYTQHLQKEQSIILGIKLFEENAV